MLLSLSLLNASSACSNVQAGIKTSADLQQLIWLWAPFSVCGQSSMIHRTLFERFGLSFDQDKDRENQSKHFVSLSLREFDSWGVFVNLTFWCWISQQKKRCLLSKQACVWSVSSSRIFPGTPGVSPILLSLMLLSLGVMPLSISASSFPNWSIELSCNLEISQCNWNRNRLPLCLTQKLWFHPEPEISSELKMKLKSVFLFPVDFKLLCFMTSSCERK